VHLGVSPGCVPDTLRSFNTPWMRFVYIHNNYFIENFLAAFFVNNFVQSIFFRIPRYTILILKSEIRSRPLISSCDRTCHFLGADLTRGQITIDARGRARDPPQLVRHSITKLFYQVVDRDRSIGCYAESPGLAVSVKKLAEENRLAFAMEYL
jgi:hypothetical protein